MPLSLNNKGFTLIEIIAVLVLAGFLTLLAGKGISLFINGFLFARDNAATAAKAEIAMMRFTKELQETDVTIDSGTSTSIGYSDDVQSHTIAGCGTASICLDGDVLVDQVESFTIEYFNDYNGSAGIFNATSTQLIKVSLELLAAHSTPVGFEKNFAVRRE